MHTQHNGVELKVVQDDDRSAEIHVALDCGTARVSVYGPRTRFGQNVPAQVNWSAIGSVGKDDALRYAAAISYAAQFAADWKAEGAS